MTRHMAVQRHLARPAIEIRGERLAKERLCRRNAAVRAKEKVDRLSLLVDRSIEVMPFASNGNVRLVGAPGTTDGPRESVPALLKCRHVPGYPSEDCVDLVTGDRFGHSEPLLGVRIIRERPQMHRSQIYPSHEGLRRVRRGMITSATRPCRQYERNNRCR